MQIMAGGQESTDVKIQKFLGQQSEACRLWGLRVETPLREKDYWDNVSAK